MAIVLGHVRNSGLFSKWPKIYNGGIFYEFLAISLDVVVRLTSNLVHGTGIPREKY